MITTPAPKNGYVIASNGLGQFFVHDYYHGEVCAEYGPFASGEEAAGFIRSAEDNDARGLAD